MARRRTPQTNKCFLCSLCLLLFNSYERLYQGASETRVVTSPSRPPIQSERRTRNGKIAGLPNLSNKRYKTAEAKWRCCLSMT